MYIILTYFIKGKYIVNIKKYCNIKEFICVNFNLLFWSKLVRSYIINYTTQTKH